MTKPFLLADTSAANTEVENDGSVVLLGNSSFFGGNSTVGNRQYQWSEHEDTAPEVNQRLWRFVHV